MFLAPAVFRCRARRPPASSACCQGQAPPRCLNRQSSWPARACSGAGLGRSGRSGRSPGPSNQEAVAGGHHLDLYDSAGGCRRTARCRHCRPWPSAAAAAAAGSPSPLTVTPFLISARPEAQGTVQAEETQAAHHRCPSAGVSRRP